MKFCLSNLRKCYVILFQYTKEKDLICFHFQHTIKFICQFTKLVSSNDLFSLAPQYPMGNNAWKINPSNKATGLITTVLMGCGRNSIHFFFHFFFTYNQRAFRSLPVSFTFYLNHSLKLCRNENPEGRINRWNILTQRNLGTPLCCNALRELWLGYLSEFQLEQRKT